MIMHSRHGRVLIVLIALLAVSLGGCLQQGAMEPCETRVTAIPGTPDTATSPGPSTPPVPAGEEAFSAGDEVTPGATLPLKERGTYNAGDRIRVGGTTILSPGNHILIEVIPQSFGPTRKGVPDNTSGVSGIVEVMPGKSGGMNSWDFVIDTGGWKTDEYLVQVRGIEVPGYAWAIRFTLEASPAGS